MEEVWSWLKKTLKRVNNICGIAGYFGVSKKPQATYQLITKLFEKTEVRGVDAAGFWGTQSGASGKIIFHKEPIKSTALVKKDIWRRTAKLNPNLLLVHARQASQGVGTPENNKNNHPFVSNNRRVGLIHNGRITELEYQSLKLKYEVFSDCDSEILLRVFEAGERYGNKSQDDFPDLCPHVATRFAGLRDIFSLVNYGHMAVAIGECLGNDRFLWLFRNKHRSLWVADMRECLGQVFFCSTPEIWQDAVNECGSLHSVIGKSHKLSEVPPEEIWFFKITGDNPNVDKVQRFDVTKEADVLPWHYDGVRLSMNRHQPDQEVICKLDENEYLVKGEKTEAPFATFDTHQLQTWCQRLREKVCDIETQAQVMTREGSVGVADFRNLLELLEQHDRDLTGTLRILGG